MGVNHSIDDLPHQSSEGPNTGKPLGKSLGHAQHPEHPPIPGEREEEPSPKPAPSLSCSASPRHVPTPRPSQQPVPRAASPWGQRSLPKIISDVWGQTCHSEESRCLGLTASLIFYSSSAASPEYSIMGAAWLANPRTWKLIGV